MTILLAILVGLAIGAALALVKLPVAAPPTLPGVLTVAGISLGYWIVTVLR